jgi:exopolysaccharide biosynthesis polyprenyl glycosylphosphotransferase
LPFRAARNREGTDDSQMIADLDARRERGQGSRRDASESRAESRADLDRRGWDRRGYVLRRLIVVSDVAALGAAYAVVAGVNAAAGPSRPVFDPGDFLLFILLVPLWVLLANLLGLYHLSERRIDLSFADELGPGFLVMTLWSWFWLVGRAAIHVGPIAVLPSVVLWAAGILLVPAFRSFLHWRARDRSWYRQAVVLIGSPSEVERVRRRVERHPEYGLDVVATLDAGTEARGNGQKAISPDRIVAQVRATGARRAIVTGWPEEPSGRMELIQTLINSRVQVDLVSAEPEALWSAAVLHHLEGLPILTLSPPRLGRAESLVKRATDLTVAGSLLLVLSPLLTYIATRIKLDSPGPVLFRQKRVGRDGARFEVLKFRTMVVGADTRKHELSPLNIHAAQPAAMFKVPNDPRITGFGAWLRRWSLDELPQLWNVLKGDMSMVGPRPLIPEEAALVKGRYSERMRVRPGITGPWQILGRSDIPFDEMVKLDYMYVATWTSRQDLTLLLRTVGAVIRARGAY